MTGMQNSPGRPLKVMLLAILTAALVAFAWPQVTAEEKASNRPVRGSYSVALAVSSVKLDGNLDEEAWKAAAVIPVQYEWLPGDNIEPPVKTEFLVTFSRDFLYLAFRCFDPEPGKIRAHLMDRDATDTLIQDDHIAVMVDPFNDERRGFQFRVNPLGVQADANFSENEGYEDFSWDAIWYSAGKIHEWGYAIEIAIPFNQLRFPKGSDVQTWGFSAERSYPRNVRHRITSHMRKRNINCILCQFDKVTGFSGMKTGLNLEADPTLTMVRSDNRAFFPSGPMEAGNIKVDPGLTLRWGITSNLVLNAAANPDFSQVEADVQELTVNRRFAVRYPEKRPFFLEGGDFFLTPIEAVFTRTVADPVGGFKLTGKEGKNAFGVFATYDRINNLLLPSNQESQEYSSDDDVGGGVFRFRRDMGKNSTLGLLYTGRGGKGYFNHVAGLDGFFRISNSKTLSFQYLHSETRYPQEVAGEFGQSEERFSGDALSATFLHQSRHWVYTANYRDMWPGFRADFGYVPRVDIRALSGAAGRLFWGKPKGWYTQLQTGFEFNFGYDHDGSLTDRTIDVFVAYRGPLQSAFTGVYARTRELFVQVPYDLNLFVISGEIKPAGGLNFGLESMFGGAVDYMNQRAAKQILLQPQAEFNLGRHLHLVLRDAYQRLSLGGETIFTANLAQVNLVYNFNVRTFVRAIFQYLDLSRNSAMYTVPLAEETNTLFTQFLFSYKLNPQTVLFIGYSDNYFGMTGMDTTRKDRTFFVKIGYAWLR